MNIISDVALSQISHTNQLNQIHGEKSFLRS